MKTAHSFGIDFFDKVEEAMDDAILIAWDGCHKIYLAMDDYEAKWFAEEYPHVLKADAETMLATLIKWYEESCPLRFVNAVTYNEEDPNAGFETLVAQFADQEDDEDEDDDYEEEEDDDEEED